MNLETWARKTLKPALLTAASAALMLCFSTASAHAQATYTQAKLSGGWAFSKAAANPGKSPITKLAGGSKNCTDNDGDATCSWTLLHSISNDNPNANPNGSHEHGEFQINDPDGGDTGGTCVQEGAFYNGADVYNGNAALCTTPASGSCSCGGSGQSDIYTSAGAFHTLKQNTPHGLDSTCHLQGTYNFKVCANTNGSGNCCFTATNIVGTTPGN